MITKPRNYLAPVVITILAPIIIMLTAKTARIQTASLPEFEKEITWNYSVKYRGSAQDMSKLPFAIRVLDIEQPEKVTVTLRPAKAGEGRAISLLLQAQNRNGTSTTTEDIVGEQNGTLKWRRFEQRMKSSKGDLIREELHHVDNPMFNYPPDIFSKECILFTIARNVLRQGKQKDKLTAWVSPFLVMSIDVFVAGSENITVPAGTFDTISYEMKPWAKDFFGPKAGPIVQPFAPGYRAWYEKSSPYRLIKYEGPLGNMPNTKRLYEVWELLK